MPKTCSRCGEQKPNTGFYKNSTRADGLQNYCKSCYTIRQRERRRFDPKERARRNADAKKLSEISRRSGNKKDWAKRHPEKIAAHSKLNKAIKSGKVHRSPCVVCGSLKSHGHHDDYSKPLDVIWLCASHHQRLHAGEITL